MYSWKKILKIKKKIKMNYVDGAEKKRIFKKEKYHMFHIYIIHGYLVAYFGRTSG